MKSKFILRLYRKENVLETHYKNIDPALDNLWEVFTNEVLDHEEVIFEGDLTTPVLERWDKFYLSQTDTTYVVEEVVVSSDDCMVYYLAGGIINKPQTDIEYDMLHVNAMSRNEELIKYAEAEKPQRKSFFKRLRKIFFN